MHAPALSIPAHVCAALLALVTGVSCGAAKPSAAAPDTAADPTQALIPAGSAGSQLADRMTSPGYSACHSSYVMKTQDVAKEVAQMAQGCATVTKMHALGNPLPFTQAAANAPQSVPLKAQAGHCYRVYGAATSGIKDLDLLVKDSAGAVAGEDSTDDPTPVVLEDGVVCFKSNDDATIVASVGDGSGAFALQVWSD
jgi:hypothetical protein